MWFTISTPNKNLVDLHKLLDDNISYLPNLNEPKANVL